MGQKHTLCPGSSMCAPTWTMIGEEILNHSKTTTHLVVETKETKERRATAAASSNTL